MIYRYRRTKRPGHLSALLKYFCAFHNIVNWTIPFVLLFILPNYQKSLAYPQKTNVKFINTNNGRVLWFWILGMNRESKFMYGGIKWSILLIPEQQSNLAYRRSRFYSMFSTNSTSLGSMSVSLDVSDIGGGLS